MSEQVLVSLCPVSRFARSVRLLTEFEASPSGWLQRFALWLLGALRLRDVKLAEMVEKTEYITIDKQSIFDSLQLSQKDIRWLWREEPKHLIIGRAEFHKLRCEADVMNGPGGMISFPHSLNMFMGDERKILGMTVHVIPWINGWAMLPDLAKHR